MSAPIIVGAAAGAQGNRPQHDYVTSGQIMPASTLAPVLIARDREQTQEGGHGWESAAHCVAPLLIMGNRDPRGRFLRVRPWWRVRVRRRIFPTSGWTGDRAWSRSSSRTERS